MESGGEKHDSFYFKDYIDCGGDMLFHFDIVLSKEQGAQSEIYVAMAAVRGGYGTICNISGTADLYYPHFGD